MGSFRSSLFFAFLLPWALAAPLAGEVSYTQERQLGKRFHFAARQHIPLVSDPEIVSYVEDIGKAITDRLEDSFFDYRFSVVRDASINAFAVPGGYIYVNLGLLSHARNDDEVAAVLGHEVAHVHAHHMARQQEKAQLLNYASLLALLASIAQPALAPLAAAVGQTAQLQYRRELEQEADYLGVRYLAGTRYDGRAMLDFFKKLESESRRVPTFIPPYLLSHPLTDERLNHLEAVLRVKQWEGHARAAAGTRLQRVQALARARLGKPRDVLDQYAKVRAEHPDSPHAAYLYGLVALEVGRLDEARPALAQAAKGGVAEATRELGRLALRERDPAAAIELLRRHLKGRDDDGAAWVELAKALDATGDAEGARRAYASAWRVEPELAEAHAGYGLLAGRAGDEGAGYYHLARAERLRGRYGKAVEQFKRALPLLGDDSAERAAAERELAELEVYLKLEKE